MTGIGLTTPLFRTIMTSMRRSRSLQAIHLSHNPFLHEATIEQINQEAVNLRGKVNEDDGIDYNHLMVPQSSFESIRLRQWRKAQAVSERKDDWAVHTHELVLQRVLGHKEDIPGLAQWTVHSSAARYEDKSSTEAGRLRPDCKCWICGKKTFTLIFWSRKIGYQYFNCRSEEHAKAALG